MSISRQASWCRLICRCTKPAHHKECRPRECRPKEWHCPASIHHLHSLMLCIHNNNWWHLPRKCNTSLSIGILTSLAQEISTTRDLGFSQMWHPTTITSLALAISTTQGRVHSWMCNPTSTCLLMSFKPRIQVRVPDVTFHQEATYPQS